MTREDEINPYQAPGNEEEALKAWAETKGYRVELQGDPATLTKVVIGESHAKKDETSAQVDLIRLLKPAAIVLEPLMQALMYQAGIFAIDPARQTPSTHFPNPEDLQKIPYESMRHLLSVADELGIPVIGCDLDSRQLCDSFSK